MAAEIDGDSVSYSDGFRRNELRAVHEWFLAGRKVAAMFEELAEDPESESTERAR